MTDNKRYNIIWIDDKCEELSGFVDEAYYEGIDIKPFQYGLDAINELEKNPSKYDGIILDVKCWYDRDEVDSVQGFYDIRDEINKRFTGKDIYFPLFVYSGQPDYISNASFKEYLRGERLYVKFNKNDEEDLYVDIKKAADQRLDTQIRHKYLSELNCDDIVDELVDIMKYSENGVTNDELFFPKVRYVIHWLMDRLNEYGILAIKHNNANINACSVFLGKPALEKYIPVHVRRSMHSCVEICNNGSHRIEIFNSVKSGEAPYLIRSVSFELLNILKWYSLLPQSSEQIDAIRKVAESIPTADISIEGELLRDADHKYYCENCLIPNFKVDSLMLQEHDWIRITKTEPNTDFKTKIKYPLFAKFLDRQ